MDEGVLINQCISRLLNIPPPGFWEYHLLTVL
jgi:hypothetical protein